MLSVIWFNFICEAPTGPMTATDKKIRQNTSTACMEILTDYAKQFLTIDSPQHSFAKQMHGEPMLDITL